MIEHLMAFGSIAIMDYCFAYYTRRASQGRATMAGVWATWLILFNSIAMILVTSQHDTIISAMAGAFVGTYLAVKRDK